MRAICRTLVVLFVLSTIGCSALSNHESRIDQAKKLMDQRDYESAISLLEDEHRNLPGDKATTMLLAEAHLGAARFEIFRLALNVLGRQNPQGEQARLEFKLTPFCHDEPITKLQGYDFRCLFIRLLGHLPDPDNNHFSRAHFLIRNAYPLAAQSPVDANFVAALVESGAALGRIRMLIERALEAGIGKGLKADPTLFPFEFFAHHLKNAIDELHQALIRIRFSYGKISSFVVSLDGKPLIRIGNRTLQFNDRLGIPELLRFAAQVFHDEGDKIDKELNLQFDRSLSGALPGFVRLFRATDESHFGSGVRDRLEIHFRFERALNRLLLAFAENGGEPSSIDLTTLAWSHPPKILQSLFEAIKTTWENEKRDALITYFSQSRKAWVELRDLTLGWDHWLNYSLSKKQRDILFDFFEKRHRNDPRFSFPPIHLTSENLLIWQSQFQASLFDGFNALFSDQSPKGLQLSLAQYAEGIDHFNRSRRWIAENLWESSSNSEE